MAITQITNYVIFGNASDTKPLAGTPSQSLFFEIDTGRTYKFTGGVWSLFSGDIKTETLVNKTITTPIIAAIKVGGGGANTLTLPTTTDTAVGRATTDTLLNKTLIAPVIATISNAGVLTLPSGTRTMVARDTADTFLNKTYNVNSNTLTATSQAVGDLLFNNGTQYIRLARGSNNQVLTSTATTIQWSSISSASTTAVNVWSAQQTFNDTMLLLRNPANTFSATLKSGAQTAARVFTFPVVSGDDTIDTNTSTATLTNKTLTSPVISTIVNTGTLTLPTSTDTLMGRATTDTMTNKTFVYANNTVTDTSAATGDIPKHNGTKFVRFGKGTANQVLQTNSTATDLAWSSFNAENTGTAQANGTGSATLFNIAHSLGTTPYSCFVQCYSHSTAFTYTFDATNIAVTFVTAPPSGTNNVKFTWRALA
jgi:hypothetical protein